MKKAILILLTVLTSVFAIDAQKSRYFGLLVGKGVQAISNSDRQWRPVGPVIPPKPSIRPVPKPRSIRIDTTLLRQRPSIRFSQNLAEYEYQHERLQTRLGGRRNDVNKLMSNLYTARQRNDKEFADICLFYLYQDTIIPNEIIDYISTGRAITSEDAKTLSSMMARGAYRCSVNYPDYTFIDKNKQNAFSEICEKYNTDWAPLAQVAFMPNDSVSSIIIKRAIDVNPVGTTVYDDDILQSLYAQYANALYAEGQYVLLLDTFTSEDLWSLVKDNIDYLLLLYNSAVVSDRDSYAYNFILDRAKEVDNVRTIEYCEQLNNAIAEALSETPEDIDTIIAYIDDQNDELKVYFAGLVISKLCEYVEKHQYDNSENVDLFSCEWATADNYSDSLRVRLDAIAAIGEHIRSICDPSIEMDGTILFCTAEVRLRYDQYYKSACEDIDAVGNAIKGMSQEDRYLTPVEIIMMQAYIKGHGLDNPKAVIKCLEQYSDIFEVGIDGLEETYEYLNYLYFAYDKLGKHKQANKIKKRMDAMIFD